MSGSFTDRNSKIGLLEKTQKSISPANALRKWAVLVDGSSVSAKAFDAASLFVTVQNGRGGEDRFTVVHCFDTENDKKKPWHLRGPFILSAYETSLIKTRRVYDGSGPQRLQVRTISKHYVQSSDNVEVCHQDAARRNVECAPTLVAALLKCNAEEVGAHFIFVGSFGEGGKKIGQHGTVTDYLVRLTNATLFIVNHWRPLPKAGEEVAFVVAVDGGEASMAALRLVMQLAKANDRVMGLLVSRFRGPADQAVMDQVRMVAASGVGPSGLEVTCEWYPMDARPAVEAICEAAEKLEADFLAVGSVNLKQGSADRESLPLIGSTALYCSHHAKCHVMVVKPCSFTSRLESEERRGVRASVSAASEPAGGRHGHDGSRPVTSPLVSSGAL